MNQRSSLPRGEQQAERADAARNRRAIMRAAEDLLQRHEPAEVSIGRVAAAAGVGKATVFHRFGSRVGLMRSLLQERAEALRVATECGPPPLGPGASPQERLTAFIDALVELASHSVGLLTVQEHAAMTSKARPVRQDDNPVYLFWHRHVSGLIAQARPDLDADPIAHVLLGATHDGPIAELLRAGQAQRVAAALHQLADGLLSSRINAR